MISPLEQVTNAALKFIEKRIQTATKEVVDGVKTAFDSFDTSRLSLQIDTLTKILVRVENNKTEKAPVVDMEPIKQPLARLEKVIAGLQKSIEQITEPVINVDTGDLGNGIKTLSQKIDSLKEAVIQKPVNPLDITPLVKAIQESSVSFPETIKLDPQQVARMSTTASVGVAPMTMATRVSNTTVSATNTATQYSYTFPEGTVAWVIKLRDQGTLGYYSWATGKLPTSGDGSDYMTIAQNAARSQQDVEYSGKTIYLGAETASSVFEIEVFRR